MSNRIVVTLLLLLVILLSFLLDEAHCFTSRTLPKISSNRHIRPYSLAVNVNPISLHATTNRDDSIFEEIMSKKVEGRKKRVIIGYKTTAIAYLLCATTVLFAKGSKQLTFSISSGHTLTAGVACILASAAASDRLSSDTYKRLNLCLIEYGLMGFITAKSIGMSFPKNMLFFLPPFITVVNSIKGYSYGVLGWDKNKSKSMLINDIVDGTKSTIKGIFFSVPKNMKSFGYLSATWMLVIMKFMKLLEIFQLIKDQANTIFIATRVSRLSRLAFLTIILYTLKDAADRGRLEGTTFIELNFLSSLSLAVMSFYYTGIPTPMNGYLGLFSGFCLWNGMSSFKKQRKASSKNV